VTPLLRPLSFSEMLDRAFALALRTILPVGAVVVVAVAGGYAGALAMVYGALKVHVGLPALLIAGVFMFSVLIAGVAAGLSGQIDGYLGRPVRLRRMLSDARHVWRRLALLALLYAAMLIVPVVAALALVEGGSLLAGQVKFFSTIFGAALLAIPFGVLLLTGYGFVSAVGCIAFVGCVAEWSSALDSWQLGWRRCVAGGRWRRTLLYGTLLVFVAFAFGVALQTMALGIAGLFPSAASLTAIAAGAGLVFFQFAFGIFQWAWFVVYYFDLRVRLEGLDLALRSDSIGRLAEAGPAAEGPA